MSRRRKTKQSSQGRSGGRRPQRSPLLEIHSEIAAALRPWLDEADPLDVEILASGLIGTWRKALAPTEDPEQSVGMALVEHAAGLADRESLALLRALASVATTENLREAAAAGADAVAAGGVPEPAWLDLMGRPVVGECWRLGDVYGDAATLVCVFGYGDRQHGMVAMLDFNHLGGWVKDLLVTDDPAGVLALLRKEATADPELVAERVDPAEAGEQLRATLAATDMTWQPETGDAYEEYRALALARGRSLPGDDTAVVGEEVDEQTRAKIVEDFMASPYAPDLPSGDLARSSARLIVDYGADYDAGRPLRVGPLKLEVFLNGWLPHRAVLEPAEQRVMGATVVGWARWAGERTGLPAEAITSLVTATTKLAAAFPKAYAEAERDSPIRNVVADLDAADQAGMQEALERRLFAMPFFGTRIGSETFDRLDPSDPDERSLLIRGEHPEYHDALEDPHSDETVDGVNPRMHLMLHEVIADQLWDDDPQEVWQAAKRCLDAGHDRHDILHALMHELGEHLFLVMQADRGEGAAPDNEAYVRRLAALGQDGPGAGGDRGRAARLAKARAARRANAAEN